MTTQLDEPIEGPVTIAGHTWNVGDRVYFPCYSMGSITAIYRSPHAAEHCQIRAHALCDDGEMRTCCLDLQGQFLGLGDHKGSYLASSLAEREEYYKNKPKHPMPYEVMMMGRKKRVEAYTDDEYAESLDRETVTSTRRSAAAAAVVLDRQSVTSTRRSATAAIVPDRQSVTPVARSVTVIDHQGNVISDYPDYPAPQGKRWNRCENCRTWFPSSRYHAKTCKPSCRKALSRKTS